MILHCGCDSRFGNKAGARYQDEKYGPGNRVANPTSKEGVVARCSVCGKDHQYKKKAKDDEAKTEKTKTKGGKQAA